MWLSLISLALVIVFWPVAVLMFAKSSFDKSRREKAATAAAFRISKDNLVEKLTISEIEKREMVSDPHNAVPDLPFGHLNKPWVNYLDELQPDGEIWSFSMKWEYEWSGAHKVEGYAAFRDGHVGPHFITLRRPLTDSD